MSIYLQPFKKGRASTPESVREILQPLCDLLIKVRETLSYTPGPRGWCYMLEGPDTWSKGDFDQIEARITLARKLGMLPLEITVIDTTRVASGLVTVSDIAFADMIEPSLRWDASNYRPHAIEEFTGIHMELWVEKIGLQSLMAAAAAKYTIPITCGRGQPDIHSRVALLNRCAEYARNIVFTMGDHDVAGLSMTESLENLLEEVLPASGLSEMPDIEFQRIGLNFDQIERLNLTWIDNLQTSGKDSDDKARDLSDPKHPQHSFAHVQDYLSKYGKRKCESDALARCPEEAANLLHDAIADLDIQLEIEQWESVISDAREEAHILLDRMFAE